MRRDSDIVADLDATESVEDAELIDAASMSELDVSGVGFQLSKPAQLAVLTNRDPAAAPRRQRDKRLHPRIVAQGDSASAGDEDEREESRPPADAVEPDSVGERQHLGRERSNQGAIRERPVEAGRSTKSSSVLN